VQPRPQSAQILAAFSDANPRRFFGEPAARFQFTFGNGWRREGSRDKGRWLAQFGNAKLSVETGAR